jgi:hypothetical protein
MGLKILGRSVLAILFVTVFSSGLASAFSGVAIAKGL